MLFLPPGPDWLRTYEALRIGERFAQDWEQASEDLWLAKPIPRTGLLVRVLVGIDWVLLTVLPLLLALRLIYVPFRWAEMLLAAHSITLSVWQIALATS